MLYIPMDIESLNTGDIILFHGSYIISKIIEFLAGTEYSHCGIIIKDPWFTPEKLTGLYVLESGSEDIHDPENNSVKYDVQLTKLEYILKNYDGSLYIRKIDCIRNNFFYNQITLIHSNIHNLPYDFDPIDWIKAFFNIDIGNVEKKNTFWCSALLSYFFVELGFLDKNLPWTIISPKAFSHESKILHFINCKLENEVKIK